jgi:DNA-binding GntR family transcriptional regulator
MLARDGWLVRWQGVGTFAGHPIDQELSTVQTRPEVLLMLGLIPDLSPSRRCGRRRKCKGHSN